MTAEKLDIICNDAAQKILKGTQFIPAIKSAVRYHRNTGMFSCLVNPLLDLFGRATLLLSDVDRNVNYLSNQLVEQILLPSHGVIDSVKNVADNAVNLSEKLDERILQPVQDLIQSGANYVNKQAEASARRKIIESVGKAIGYSYALK